MDLVMMRTLKALCEMRIDELADAQKNEKNASLG